MERPESGNTSTTVYNYDPNKTGDGPGSLMGTDNQRPNNLQTIIEPKNERKK